MNLPEVSVLCNTYNHEKYIKDAVESFLMQRTKFRFEVLIHDDASTDNTAAIIREFEQKYPGIIKPIYQKENQYSKGINIIDEYQVPRLQGKYVAFCEGDDYWTDPRKLQKQFEIMEKYLDVDICAHSATRVKALDGTVVGYMRPSNQMCIFSVEEVIAGGGGFVATNSLFLRRDLFLNKPQFRKVCPLDYSLQIQGSLRGGMLYLPDDMSNYRVMVPGSWTDRIVSNKKFHFNKIKEIIDMLDILNKETNEKYCDIISKTRLKLKFDSLEVAEMYDVLRQGELKKLYDEKPLLWKLKLYIKENLPFIVNTYRKLK